MSGKEKTDEQKAAEKELLKEDHERCKKLVDAVNELSKVADKLPKLGRGYELCNSYSGFPQLIIAIREKINAHITKIYKNAACKVQLSRDHEDLSKLIEANLYLDEKINLAIDHAYAELKGDKVNIQVLEKSAASHTGAASYASITDAYGKDSDGRYKVLGKNAKPEDDLSMLLHGGLYVAKNLPKPQINFQGFINNADAPFMPKLGFKHHAKTQQRKDVPMMDDDASNRKQWSSDMRESDHPYDFELTTFEIPAVQLKKVEPRPLKKLEEIKFSIVNTKEMLLSLVEKLNKETIFGVDLEHHSFRTFLGLTSLVQISTETEDFIIDPFPIWGDMGLLNEPFTDPNILKIFHGADEDIQWLQRDFGIYVVNMFDTHVAMKTLEMTRLSLQYLVEHFCGITLGKELQKADWRIRPLSLAHLQYARGDTHYLIYCYEMLRNLLLESGTGNQLQEVYIRSKNVCRKTYQQPRFNKFGFVKLISHRRPTDQQLFALERLWQWRDKVARQEDESPSYVLPDQMLMQIAEVLPREKEGIIACCSPVPMFLKRDIKFLHRIMVEAREIKVDVSRTSEGLNDSWKNTIHTLSDVSEKSPFEKRLEEMFSCDCNADLHNYNSNQDMETDDKAGEIGGVNSDKVFVIPPTHAVHSPEFENTVRLISEWVTPYEAYQIALNAQR